MDAGPGAPTSKAEHAYNVIRHGIMGGAFVPGSRLVIEQIARAIETSVIPVREAIRRLEAEGLVVYTRNVGATVATIDLDRYPEMIEAVAVLEGAAIGLAAPHISARDIKRARSLNSMLRRSLRAMDAHRFGEIDHRFHEALYQRCPNRRVLVLLNKEWERLDRMRGAAFAFTPERALSGVEEHEHLLQLIERGRPPSEIETFTRAHRNSTGALLPHGGDQP